MGRPRPDRPASIWGVQSCERELSGRLLVAGMLVGKGCPPMAGRRRALDLPLRRSFHAQWPTAAFLIRAGCSPSGYRLVPVLSPPVLARDWHGASWMQTTGVLPFGCRCPSVRRTLRVADIRDCREDAACDHALACLPLDERRCPGRRRIWTAVVS
jgi:hypothetical protein